MTDVEDEEDYDANYLFNILLQLTHPAMRPDDITQALGREPDGDWVVGEPRKTPAGQPMEGHHKQTYWYASDRIERRRDFFDAGLELVDRTLKPHAAFLARFKESGGRVLVTLQLVGDVNIGDVLEPEVLGALSQLGIALGVEVFPDMD